jgi:hypothetical protein
MPEPKSFHCLAVLENGDLFVAGGQPKGTAQETFIYVKEKRKWERCPDMIKGRKFASCGVVRRGGGGGEEIVVAGGSSGGSGWSCPAVEIFNVRERTWRHGKQIEIE